VPGFGGPVATVVAGGVGTLAAFALAWLLAALLAPRRAPGPPPATGDRTP
jgi:hypothetical protein